jgi:hypothetical protein
LKRFLLVTNSGQKGCRWHIFQQGDDECLCKRYSAGQVDAKDTQKTVTDGELTDLLREDQSPGLGSWARPCREKGLEQLTGEKQFSCSICGQSISNISGLKIHVARTHGKSMEAAEEMAAKGGA